MLLKTRQFEIPQTALDAIERRASKRMDRARNLFTALFFWAREETRRRRGAAVDRITSPGLLDIDPREWSGEEVGNALVETDKIATCNRDFFIGRMGDELHLLFVAESRRRLKGTPTC